VTEGAAATVTLAAGGGTTGVLATAEAVEDFGAASAGFASTGFVSRGVAAVFADESTGAPVFDGAVDDVAAAGAAGFVPAGSDCFVALSGVGAEGDAASVGRAATSADTLPTASARTEPARRVAGASSKRAAAASVLT
jgi:hypothetical protein